MRLEALDALFFEAHKQNAEGSKQSERHGIENQQRQQRLLRNKIGAEAKVGECDLCKSDKNASTNKGIGPRIANQRTERSIDASALQARPDDIDKGDRENHCHHRKQTDASVLNIQNENIIREREGNDG